jgi:hypothetical protein
MWRNHLPQHIQDLGNWMVGVSWISKSSGTNKSDEPCVTQPNGGVFPLQNDQSQFWNALFVVRRLESMQKEIGMNLLFQKAGLLFPILSATQGLLLFVSNSQLLPVLRKSMYLLLEKTAP